MGIIDASKPQLANPVAIPADLVTQRRTMEFTGETMPAALRNDHNTKAGTWGLIHVQSGTLRYDITDDRRQAQSIVLTADTPPGIVEPTILHHVEPIGEVSFHVEFLREPDTTTVIRGDRS